MPNWNELPLEILNLLFAHLKTNDEIVGSNKDLAQCALTCRQWKDPAQRVFFSKITFSKMHDIDSLSMIVLKNDRLGKWVKSLRFVPGAPSCNSSSILTLALMYPNLEEIDFRCNDFSYSYFCQMLIECGKFGKLKVLPKAESKQQSEQYLKCLEYLKDSVTSIDLIDRFDFGELCYDRLRNKLHNFPKLNNVRINTFSLDFEIVTKYLKYVLDFDLITFQNLSIINANNSVTFNFDTHESTRLPLTATTLKNVSMTVKNTINYVPSEDFMQLVMNKLSCLSSFYCVQQNKKYTNATFTVPTESLASTLLQFFKFLSKLDTYIFTPIPLLIANATQLIEDFYNDLDKEESMLSLSSKRLLCISTRARKAIRARNIDDSAVGIEYSPSGYQTIHLVRFLTCRKQYDVKYDTKQLEIIEKVGRFFYDIQLQVVFKENLFDFLNHLGTHGTRLAYLHISGSRSRRSEVKRIAFEECEIVKFCKLKTLTLINHIFSQRELVCVLCRFTTLKSLTLRNCFMHNEEVPCQNLFSISLPDLSLHSLIIGMNLDFSDSTKEKSYYFKLTTTDEYQSSRYCIMTSKYNDKKELIGYKLKKNLSESVFYNSNINQKKVTTHHIHCKSILNFDFEYYNAAENGHPKKN